jgi:hypothetical protein
VQEDYGGDARWDAGFVRCKEKEKGQGRKVFEKKHPAPVAFNVYRASKHGA